MATPLRQRIADLPDDEIMRMHENMRAVRDTRCWAEIAATFPELPTTIEEWRAIWKTFDYGPVLAWREEAARTAIKEGLSAQAIKAWYRTRPKEFIEHWGTTYDPRNAGTNRPVKMPMLLFPKQREFIDFLSALLSAEGHGLAEKVRDFGATWLAALFSIQLWVCEPGSSVGWGSRKEELVDRIGDPDSIFEKIRRAIRELPVFLKPEGLSEADHLVFMKCLNPETGATITGECGDNIGRGGRSLIYFKDESAHYARPELIEAALGDNTRVQVDISTPNGLGNVFHRRREAGEDWTGGEIVSGQANVFVMDWRDHPGKDQAWYDERREKAVREGLLHKFKQEVDRDYAASVEGIIIQPEWIKACIDAHIKLGFDDSGSWRAALDVADGEGGDTNALAGFKGPVLRKADNWGARDTGVTTRRAIAAFEDVDVDLNYDSIGVGAGVKAEANRLEDEGELPFGIRFIPWNAGAAVLDPDEPVNEGDRDSITNRDMFVNLKAQAWWRTARKCENTYRAITEGIAFEPHQMISFDSRLPHIRQIEKELAQATMKKREGDGKHIVNKTPEGTKSPNLGDAVIMADNPVPGLKPVYATASLEFQVAPFKVPDFWPKGFAMKVEPTATSVLWGAYDKHQDILYITTEHIGVNREPSVNAAAIRSRGIWIPGVIDSDETNLEARREMAAVYAAFELQIMLADRAYGAGVQEVAQRIATGRLKVSGACQRFFREYRAHRRDDDGNVIGKGLMDCIRILARPSTLVAMKSQPTTFTPATFGYGRPTPSHVGDSKMGY